MERAEYRGAAEMLDSMLYDQPLEQQPWTYERTMAHAVLQGEIDLSSATVALDAYEAWLDN